MNAYTVRFNREFAEGRMKIKATVLGTTASNKDVKQSFVFEWGCIPQIMRDLREAWKIEADIRNGEITRVNRALGIEQP
jgi:hypothetical protein